MRLTPLDIRKQEFTRSFRGLHADEVTSFLQMLSNQWEEMLTEQRQLEQKVRDAEVKLEHYVKIEEALQEALRTARESAKQALENAQHQANQLLREAERRSDEIRRSAEQERLALRREAGDVRTRRNEIAARLRAFLNSELELLAHFESDSPAAPDVKSGSEPGAHEASPSERMGWRAGGFQGESNASPTDHQGQRAGGAVRDLGGEGTGMAVEEGHMAGAEHDRAGANLDEPHVNTNVHKEEGRSTGWVVRPVISAPPMPKHEESEHAPEAEAAGAEPEPEQDPDSYGISASVDEIERIKRILKDLE